MSSCQGLGELAQDDRLDLLQVRITEGSGAGQLDVDLPGIGDGALFQDPAQQLKGFHGEVLFVPLHSCCQTHVPTIPLALEREPVEKSQGLPIQIGWGYPLDDGELPGIR